MKKNNTYIAIIVLAILVLVVAVYFDKKEKSSPSETSTSTTDGVAPENGTTTSTSGSQTTTKPQGGGTAVSDNVKGMNTYANSVYNFSIKYPSYVKPQQAFSTFHEISNNWRVYPAVTNQGKGVVAFPIYNVDQGTLATANTSYPLYFIAEVRVGVSQNVRDCYATDPGFTNQKVTNVTINGVVFKKFSASDAAMMKYVQVESYRTIRNNNCIVLEQIKAGSSYRDDKMKPGISDTALTGYYNVGESIIKTFIFTK